jgi:hypothetical protein
METRKLRLDRVLVSPRPLLLSFVESLFVMVEANVLHREQKSIADENPPSRLGADVSRLHYCKMLQIGLQAAMAIRDRRLVFQCSYRTYDLLLPLLQLELPSPFLLAPLLSTFFALKECFSWAEVSARDVVYLEQWTRAAPARAIHLGDGRRLLACVSHELVQLLGEIDEPVALAPLLTEMLSDLEAEFEVASKTAAEIEAKQNAPKEGAPPPPAPAKGKAAPAPAKGAPPPPTGNIEFKAEVVVASPEVLALKNYLLSRVETAEASAAFAKKIPDDIAAQILPPLAKARDASVAALLPFAQHPRYMEFAAHVASAAFDNKEWATVQAVFAQVFDQLKARQALFVELRNAPAKEAAAPPAPVEPYTDRHQKAVCSLQRWMPVLHRRAKLRRAWRSLSTRDMGARARLQMLRGLALFKAATTPTIALAGAAAPPAAPAKGAAPPAAAVSADDGKREKAITAQELLDVMNSLRRAVVLACRSKKWVLMVEAVGAMWDVLSAQGRGAPGAAQAEGALALPLQVACMCVVQMVNFLRTGLAQERIPRGAPHPGYSPCAPQSNPSLPVHDRSPHGAGRAGGRYNTVSCGGQSCGRF